MEAMIDAIQTVAQAEPEAEVQPQPATPDVDAATEFQLSEEISTLWGQHTELSGTRKATAKELRLLRGRLAQKLHEMKSLLSRPGRGGEWRGWLREIKIPRSTADRLVSRYVESLEDENGNVLSGAITGGEDSVEQLVQSLLPRLRPRLPDTQAVFRFIAAVGEAFGLKSETTEDCIMVSQPKEQGETSPSATGAAEAAPADVTFPGADALASEPASMVGAQA